MNDASRWQGPPIGVMRPGFVAVSGCRPPKGVDDQAANWDLFRAILADAQRYVRELPGYRVAHGGAQGLDITAAAASRKRPERYFPNYDRDGQRAPMLRNFYVTTTELAVFWPAPWSRGTWDAVEKRLRHCGAQGFELRLVGWGKGGEGVPDGVKKILGKVGVTWTEVSL